MSLVDADLSTYKGRARFAAYTKARDLGSIYIVMEHFLHIRAWEQADDNSFPVCRFKHSQRGLEADYGPLGFTQ